jgi:hypothetical protein
MLTAVVISRRDRGADLAVVGPLSRLVDVARVCIQPLDDLASVRALIAEPDRSCDDQDLGRFDEPLVDVGELIVLVSVLAHVGPQPCRDLVVGRADLVDRHADLYEDPPHDLPQAIGVTRLRRALRRAVEHNCPKVVVSHRRAVGLLVDEAPDGLG